MKAEVTETPSNWLAFLKKKKKIFVYLPNGRLGNAYIWYLEEYPTKKKRKYSLRQHQQGKNSWSKHWKEWKGNGHYLVNFLVSSSGLHFFPLTYLSLSLEAINWLSYTCIYVCMQKRELHRGGEMQRYTVEQGGLCRWVIRKFITFFIHLLPGAIARDFSVFQNATTKSLILLNE